METGLVAALLLVVDCFVVVWIIRKLYGRARRSLERWVDDQGYSLVAGKLALFRKGPYTWTSSNAQMVFRITILDERGQERTGWVRCGSWIMHAAFSDDVDGVLDEALCPPYMPQ